MEVPDQVSQWLTGQRLSRPTLGRRSVFQKLCRQLGGLSLPDCRQGHSLAPGQDKHVISSRCFPELEGGAHLLSDPLPHLYLGYQQWLTLMCAQLRGWDAGQAEGKMSLPIAPQHQKGPQNPQQRLRWLWQHWIPFPFLWSLAL